MPNLEVSFFVFMLQLKFINENLGFFFLLLPSQLLPIST